MPQQSPITATLEIEISQSAMRHIRFDFNPSKLDDVSAIKTLTGALITKIEKMMHKTIERDELCTDAIRMVRAASMAAVLAATAELPKDK